MKSGAFGVHLVDTYKVSLHSVYSNLHTPVHNCIRKNTHTGHYTDHIPKVPYASVYLSIHIEYTGSLYLLIQAISCSESFGRRICHRRSRFSPAIGPRSNSQTTFIFEEASNRLFYVLFVEELWLLLIEP